MSHSICINVATSRFPIQRLLAWPICTCNSYSSRECRGLPRHTIMCNSLGSTWKSRSDSGEHCKGAPHSWEHWKGAPPFVSRQCFPNRPKHFMASVSADHPVFPPPASCWCPNVSAAIVPVLPPQSFPPTIGFCRIRFSPISTLFSALSFVPAFFFPLPLAT